LHEKLEKCTYINPNTKVEQTLEMHDSLEKLSIDCAFASLRPLNVIFPWLVEYDIGEFNKINTKNSDDVVRVIKNFLENAEDKESVYFKVLEAEKGLPRD